MTAAGPRSVRVVGPGRAGSALSTALAAVGWSVAEPVRRGDDLTGAADGRRPPGAGHPRRGDRRGRRRGRARSETTVVAHLAGSLGLDVLAPHPRRAAVHPLVSLPDAEVGARRLRSGAWFAVAGDPPEALALVEALVVDLGGRSFTVADADRAAYHAAAAIASNHLVALLGQVERVAAGAGVPLEAYLDLVRVTLDNVAELGPAAALTGPVARGDWATVERHRAALPADELVAYDAMVAAARRLVDDVGDTAGPTPRPRATDEEG